MLAFVLAWLTGTFSSTGLAAVHESTKDIGLAAISPQKIDAFRAALVNDGFTVTEWTYGKVDVTRLVCSGSLETGYVNNAGGNYLAITKT